MMTVHFRDVKRLGLAASVILALIGSSCSAHSVADPQLRIWGTVNPSVEARIHPLAAGQPVVIGSMMVCLSAPGSLRISDVVPVNGVGGVVVRRFELRPNPIWAQGGDTVVSNIGTLPNVGFAGTHVTALTCNQTTGRASELGVELSKASKQPAMLDGFLISYSGDGEGQTLTFPYRIVLCSKGEASGPCRGV